jgi:hypothetical protein
MNNLSIFPDFTDFGIDFLSIPLYFYLSILYIRLYFPLFNYGKLMLSS